MTDLTENFTLEEMTASQTAVRLDFDEQFSPADSIKDNLKALCENVLEPIRSLASCSIRISSGYRCERANEAIKGAKTSQHLKGQAADISARCLDTEELYTLIKESNIIYDQLLQEYGRWVHISFTSVGENRMQRLRAIKVDGITKYIPD